MSAPKPRGFLVRLTDMTEFECLSFLERERWASSDGVPECALCGERRKIFRLGTRRPAWRCRVCGYTTSIFSGTWLASNKLSAKLIILSAALFLMPGKGAAALTVSQAIGCQYKTAFSFGHKIREAISKSQNSGPLLCGHVEIDGAFFGGHTERYNYIDRRTGKIHARRRYGERRVVVVAKQRGGQTRTFIGKKESDALLFIQRNVDLAATLYADMAHAWDGLDELYSLLRVNHAVEFSTKGKRTNEAESFFSGLRAKQRGVHHRMSGRYLDLYAAELSWKRDNRSLTLDDRLRVVLRLLLSQIRRSRMAGYWQKSQRKTAEVIRIGVSHPSRTPSTIAA
jgi:transposase-like protein